MILVRKVPLLAAGSENSRKAARKSRLPGIVSCRTRDVQLAQAKWTRPGIGGAASIFRAGNLPHRGRACTLGGWVMPTLPASASLGALIVDGLRPSRCDRRLYKAVNRYRISQMVRAGCR